MIPFGVEEVLKGGWTNTWPGLDPPVQSVFVPEVGTAEVEFGNTGQAVPTLTQWGFIAMALVFLAAIAGFGLRAKRRAATR